MPSVDASTCPSCGRSNRCAMSTPGADASACWCTTVTIPAAALARIPGGAKGRACLCAACARGEPAPTGQVNDPGGRPAVRLRDGDHEVLIARTGAQVLSYRSAGEEVLWQAGHAEFTTGRPVRGGVPLVFPWFGDHPQLGRPAHGYARNLDWQLQAHDATSAVFTVEHDGDAGWPHAVAMQVRVQLDGGLHLAWRVRNPGPEPITYEQALHTYYAVGEVHRASVHGLEHVAATEHAAAPCAAWDRGAPVTFTAETDRIYQGVPDTIVLRAPALRREVVLTTANARSAIVWNPWPAKNARLPQMAPDDWRTFVCIESANVREHAVQLPAGGEHTLSLSVVARALTA